MAKAPRPQTTTTTPANAEQSDAPAWEDEIRDYGPTRVTSGKLRWIHPLFPLEELSEEMVATIDQREDIVESEGRLVAVRVDVHRARPGAGTTEWPLVDSWQNDPAPDAPRRPTLDELRARLPDGGGSLRIKTWMVIQREDGAQLPKLTRQQHLKLDPPPRAARPFAPPPPPPAFDEPATPPAPARPAAPPSPFAHLSPAIDPAIVGLDPAMLPLVLELRKLAIAEKDAEARRLAAEEDARSKRAAEEEERRRRARAEDEERAARIRREETEHSLRLAQIRREEDEREEKRRVREREERREEEDRREKKDRDAERRLRELQADMLERSAKDTASRTDPVAQLRTAQEMLAKIEELSSPAKQSVWAGVVENTITPIVQQAPKLFQMWSQHAQQSAERSEKNHEDLRLQLDAMMAELANMRAQQAHAAAATPAQPPPAPRPPPAPAAAAAPEPAPEPDPQPAHAPAGAGASAAEGSPTPAPAPAARPKVTVRADDGTELVMVPRAMYESLVDRLQLEDEDPCPALDAEGRPCGKMVKDCTAHGWDPQDDDDDEEEDEDDGAPEDLGGTSAFR